MTQVNEYLETAVMTAPAPQLHLMTVDATLKAARKALLAMDEGRQGVAMRALERAREGVTELLGGLREEVAPALVRRQKAIFLFVYRSLALAQLLQRPEEIQDAVRVLEIHRQTWVDLTRQLSLLGDESASPWSRDHSDSLSTGGPHTRSWTT